MTSEWWKKVKRYLTPTTRCPFCGKLITANEAGVTYSKTCKGTHVFAHEKCAGLKGGSDD